MSTFAKTILVDAVDTFVVEGKIFGEMHELLEEYPNRKIIVTNASDSQMDGFGLRNLPYELFTMEHEPDKTDPTYFEELLAHYSLQADDVVYFDHSLEAVESAQLRDIAAHHYDHRTQDLDALKRFLDEHLIA